jgi:hypothetical protein
MKRYYEIQMAEAKQVHQSAMEQSEERLSEESKKLQAALSQNEAQSSDIE